MLIAKALAALQRRVAALGRWRARLLALVLGGVSILAMPPLYQVYLLAPALSGLLWLAAAAPTRWQAFAVGWWFGAGFFGASLYWVSFALLVEADKFAWLIPIAILGFGFGLGLFSALAALAVRLTPGNLSAKVLVLAGTWALLEWLRAWIFTGLPWNPVGSIWAFSDAMIQGAAQVGVFGLSLVTVWAAAAVGAVADDGAHLRRAPRFVSGLAFLALVLFWGAGQQRLDAAADEDVPNVRLRLVQPNIPQAEKWRPELRQRNMAMQLDFSAAPPHAGEPAPTHVIWAETSAPFFLANHEPWRKRVAAVTPPGGVTILGAPRLLSDPSREAAPNAPFKVANALLAVDGQGDVVASYDKFHLVPFGEYVPLSDWLPLDKITQGAGAFTPGPGPVTLTLPGLPPLSPLICYEVIFPHEVTDPAHRPQWLLNLTNDAWYGKTAGPHQHFVSARLRAAEEGLPAVRVAFTGISGIIDAYGRVRAQRALGEKGFVDGNLPKALETPGLYARFGNTVPVTLALALIVLGLACGLRAPHPIRADK